MNDGTRTQSEVDQDYIRAGWKRPQDVVGLTFAALDRANSQRQIDWDEGNAITLQFLSNALGGEKGEYTAEIELMVIDAVLTRHAGQFQNMVKKLEREAAGLRGGRSDKLAAGKELADIVMYAALSAQKLGFNLGDLVQLKFNETSEKYGFDTRL